MPELLRAYGEIARQRPDAETIVAAALIGIVLLVVATISIGALIEAVLRAWKRSHDRHSAPDPTLPGSRHVNA